MSTRASRRAQAAGASSAAAPPSADFLGDTDLLNEARGAAPEGEPSEPRPAFVLPAPRAWAAQPEPEPDNTFYAAPAVPSVPRSLIPAPAPDGWLRDVDGNLWAAETVTGLEVVGAATGGEHRYHVAAHTTHGRRTLSTHFGDAGLASAHLETVAALIRPAPSVVAIGPVSMPRGMDTVPATDAVPATGGDHSTTDSDGAAGSPGGPE